MTQQKSQKRRVRERMARTGERYTAARTHVLRVTIRPGESTDADLGETTRAAPVSPTPSEAAAVPPQPAPDPDAPGIPAPKEELILARTGRPWPDWRSELDAWGAAGRPHRDIARWLIDERGVDSWWAQELTVTYERAIGRRQVGQQAHGFSISVTRTIGAPVERLFRAVADEDERASWVGGASLRVRTSSAPRGARFDWDGGPERIVVGLTAKGDSRSVIALAHERIADRPSADARKAFWVARLDELKAALEA